VSARTAGSKNWMWVSIVGLSAALVFVALTLAAVALYPGSTSPMDRYLSELGNADQSPDGWLFFDLAMILTGVLALPFFWGLSKYNSGRAGKRLTRAALWLGVTNAVAVAVAGGVAEHVNMTAHIIWSLLIFASAIPLLVVYGVVLRKSPGFSRVVAWYGFIACAVDLALLVAVGIIHSQDPGVTSVLEWVVVLLYIVWVALISLDVARDPELTLAGETKKG